MKAKEGEFQEVALRFAPRPEVGMKRRRGPGSQACLPVSGIG